MPPKRKQPVKAASSGLIASDDSSGAEGQLPPPPPPHHHHHHLLLVVVMGVMGVAIPHIQIYRVVMLLFHRKKILLDLISINPCMIFWVIR